MSPVPHIDPLYPTPPHAFNFRGGAEFYEIALLLFHPCLDVVDSGCGFTGIEYSASDFIFVLLSSFIFEIHVKCESVY